MITERASGLFIWARLVADRSLELEREGASTEEVLAEVADIRPDLDHLYGNILRKSSKSYSKGRVSASGLVDSFLQAAFSTAGAALGHGGACRLQILFTGRVPTVEGVPEVGGV